MLIQRRRLIKAVVTAPFVIGIGKSRALPLRDSVSPVDKTASTLASLADSTWSPNQIALGNLVTDLNFGGNMSIGNVFAYSGGCYLPGRKKYMLPGTGGHNDSPNTGIATLDLLSLTWSVTEPSAQYHTGGVADPGNPCTNEEKTYKSWPNINGQRAPMAGHRYSTPNWMPEIGYGYSYGQWSYNIGTRNHGYYLFNASGRHDQTKGFSSGFGGTNTLTTIWVPRRKVLWCATSGGLNSYEMDPLIGTVTRPCNFSSNQVYPDIGLQGPPCLIPDPNNAGDQAVVFWTYNYYAGAEKIFYCPKVGSGAVGQKSSAILFNGAVPSALSVGTRAFVYHNSCWFDFAGNYKLGSTKILVWDWASALTGLYLLDTATWTWSGPLAGSAAPFSGTGFVGNVGFKLIFVLTDYVVRGSYIPVGVIKPVAGYGQTGGHFSLYKIPWSAV